MLTADEWNWNRIHTSTGVLKYKLPLLRYYAASFFPSGFNPSATPSISECKCFCSLQSIAWMIKICQGHWSSIPDLTKFLLGQRWHWHTTPCCYYLTLDFYYSVTLIVTWHIIGIESVGHWYLQGIPMSSENPISDLWPGGFVFGADTQCNRGFQAFWLVSGVLMFWSHGWRS